MSTEGAHLIAGKFRNIEEWNFSSGLTDDSTRFNYYAGLMIVCSKDGVFSDTERDWVIGYAASLGADDAMISRLERYAHKIAVSDSKRLNATLKKHLLQILEDSIDSAVRQEWIYDAIRAASSDGYSDGEKHAVREAAAIMGIDERKVVELEILVLEEAVIKAKRYLLTLSHS